MAGRPVSDGSQGVLACRGEIALIMNEWAENRTAHHTHPCLPCDLFGRICVPHRKSVLRRRLRCAWRKELSLGASGGKQRPHHQTLSRGSLPLTHCHSKADAAKPVLVSDPQEPRSLRVSSKTSYSTGPARKREVRGWKRWTAQRPDLSGWACCLPPEACRLKPAACPR